MGYVLDVKDSNSDFIAEPESEYNSNRDFISLECWKKCRDVRQYFYSKVIPCLPKEEKYNLDNQIRKASVSTTANIYPVK